MARHFEVGVFPVEKTEKRLPDEFYSRALDRFVISCLDIAVVNAHGELFLGKRAWEPAKDLFWIVGGARNRGESFEQSAKRLLQVEMGLEVDLTRFTFVTSHSYAFVKRRQEPAENGVHTDSHIFTIRLTEAETEAVKPNEEYQESLWIRPEEVLAQADRFSPAIIDIAEKLLVQPVVE